MILTALNGLGLMQKLAMLAAVLAMLGFAYWWVWDTGREYERVKWQEASIAETARQAAINEEARIAADLMVEELHAATTERDALVERLTNEANSEAGSDAQCISPAGVMRLNSVGPKADTE